MESIYLSGSEDVRTAGCTMRSAAEDMRRAADNIDSSLIQHQNFLTNWLMEFQAIMKEAQS